MKSATKGPRRPKAAPKRTDTPAKARMPALSTSDKLELEKLKRLLQQLEAHRTLLSDDRSRETIAMATGYWIGYPMFIFLICRNEQLAFFRTGAMEALQSVHQNAAGLLVELAEEKGLDGGALWKSAMLCRDLCRTHFTRCTVDEAWSQWPSCIRRFELELPQDYRETAREGEAALAVLSARLKLSTPTPPALPAPIKTLPHSHDDGPEPPNHFWYNNRCATLEPAPWRLLDFLWEKRPQHDTESQPIEWTAACDATANGSSESVSDPSMKNHLRKINKALLNTEYPKAVCKKLQFIVWE